MGTHPSPKRGGGGAPPIFGPCLLWLNGCMDQNATWYGGRLGPDDILLNEDSAPLPKKGTEPPPQLSAHIYCSQTAGWIKMALRMEVGRGQGHIVLDGDPVPLPKKGREPPLIFCQFLANVKSRSRLIYAIARPSVCLSVVCRRQRSCALHRR